MAATAKQVQDASAQQVIDHLTSGGMWERQRLMGGKRLTQEFDRGEEFVLHEMSIVGEVEVEEGSKAPKVELTVSTLNDPSKIFTVGALSRAIVDLAQEDRAPGDLPAVVYWDEVETKRKLQAAVVIIGVRPFKN